jgi:hypothetical protein
MLSEEGGQPTRGDLRMQFMPDILRKERGKAEKIKIKIIRIL